MSLRKKKDCCNCRALDRSRGPDYETRFKCDLKYEIKVIKFPAHGLIYCRPIPVEICPKPRTWAQYDLCFAEQDNYEHEEPS